MSEIKYEKLKNIVNVNSHENDNNTGDLGASIKLNREIKSHIV